MLAKLIDFSLENRFLVFTITALVALGGAYSALELPIDAVPDMTNVQVTVITEAGALSPVEVERYITYPVEQAMGGLPRVDELRSVSKFGISVVTIVFEEGTDLYRSRQLVAERLADAASELPAAYGAPTIGPLATALGEVLQFEVRGEGYSATDLRTLLEWDIAPRLREVRGVTEINTHGGYYKSFEVRPDPVLLASHGLTLQDIAAAIESNNASAGGGYAVYHDEQRFIRGQAVLANSADIEEIVVHREPDGSPLLIRDLAEVCTGALARQGAVTRDARGEAVTGLVMMLVGENSRQVVERVKTRLDEIGPTLPAGVRLEVIYDRAALIGRTIRTVVTNLVEGGALVILVLLLMLGSFRAGVITALAIPLSMMFATNLMLAFGVTASLMSLGAIDFGLIVDSSVIMVENCVHRLSHASDGRSRLDVIRDAAIEVRKPTMFGELIIAVVYVPILLLEGSEGKLFRPMALTVLFALLGSLILSMTLMPALASLALPRNLADKEFIVTRALKRVYRPMANLAIDRPALTALVALAIFGLSIPVAVRLGAEFMPRLEEGDLLIEATRLPSASLEGALEVSRQIETIVGTFPEVKTVFCKTGRPEIANDVMGVHQTDVWVILHDRRDWPSRMTRNELIDAMAAKLNAAVPGVAFGFTQPIEMRVDELVAGVKADVAASLYGDDLLVLAQKAKEIERVLSEVPGGVDVKADYQANIATMTILPRRDRLAQYGLTAQDVISVVEALGGVRVGVVYEGRARVPVMLQLPKKWREDQSSIEQLPVGRAGGKAVPLVEVAEVKIDETPPAVEHDANRRRTIVSANCRGRDVASFVADARAAVDEQVELPPGYELRWGGDFENLRSASRRLLVITPIVLLLIFLLLHTSLKSPRLALLIFFAVPMAASGGVFALAVRGMPFSISAAVGFIALFGVAVLNGLVWVSAAETTRRRGFNPKAAARETAVSRLRPVLMTALVASLGFLPMALSHSDGAEMQRPLATVVIGGLITSTLLTSLVVPSIYPWFAPRDEASASACRATTSSVND
jgi:cobalt-zinc-cadmium resistance protein CzcA